MNVFSNHKHQCFHVLFAILMLNHVAYCRAVEPISPVLANTRYAVRYTTERFAQINIGMTGKEVFLILGVPFERKLEPEAWLYSVPRDKSKAHESRMIEFKKDAQGVPRVTCIAVKAVEATAIDEGIKPPK